MSRITLPTRPLPGDQLQINGGPTRTIVETADGGRLRFDDGSTATWRLERETR